MKCHLWFYMIKVYKKENTNITYREIVDLLHESFHERLDQGLNYTCSTITEQEYIRKTENGVVFVAIDKNNKEFVGTSTLNIHIKGTVKYGYLEYVAIKNSYKHRGIGSLLVPKEYARKLHFSFILSDTSINAKSAVNFHLKNGFKIIGLESFKSTNYWSYIFRMQLTPSLFWNNPTLIRLHYLISFILIKFTKNKAGEYTFIGKIYYKIRTL